MRIKRRIIDEKIEEYLFSLRAPRDKVLSEMEALAKEKRFPIVGPDVGVFLYILAKASKAKMVLELGSGFGYSAYWFAKALPKDGVVHCTDGDPKNEKLAYSFFKKGDMLDKLRFNVGNALEIVEHLPGFYDIIFCDIDKEGYPEAIGKVLPRLAKNGLFIADNALWDGAVVEECEHEESTAGILKFNEAMSNHKEFDSIIIPIRDGLMLARKR
ncbi:MAG: class I SAM-dependent methyltransferase [Myxococcota bacterium]